MKKIIVIAKANAKQTSIVRTTQSPLFGPEVYEYKVSVTADPVNNRANNAIIAVLAEYFSVPQSCVTLHSGQTSKRKVFIIE